MADDEDFSSIGIPRTAPLNPAKATASLDRPPTNASSAKPTTGVVQPKPQALTKRVGPSSIIVSPRQKGNPLLTHIKSLPWEYGDTPADYILGATTCALFLSLKYHRLHPEYIYTRIKNLKGMYNLRVVLCMVDIQNHEAPLRELSKTSLINNVTLILCWSAQEGGRYLELFKTYENAAPTSIKVHQSTSYADRLQDFVTTPRSINKTDAVSLVSQFGSIRTAVNARYEDVVGIAGWGEKKVERWVGAVREPFRVARAGKRNTGEGVGVGVGSQMPSREGTMSRGVTVGEGEGLSLLQRGEALSRPGTAGFETELRPPTSLIPQDSTGGLFVEDDDDDDDEGLAEVMANIPAPPRPVEAQQLAQVQAVVPQKRKPDDDPLTDGVMAALSKLRKT